MHSLLTRDRSNNSKVNYELYGHITAEVNNLKKKMVYILALYVFRDLNAYNNVSNVIEKIMSVHCKTCVIV